VQDPVNNMEIARTEKSSEENFVNERFSFFIIPRPITFINVFIYANE
jgi:hypothetical protein